jgi:putative zinc finger protein
MNTTCTYHGNREDLLVAYLYDDVDPSDRAAFEEHIAACAVCGRELDELGVVRSRLGGWSPPEPARALTSATTPPVGRRGIWATLGAIPAWAQVAAALLFVGVAARVANLDVTYDRNGLSVRTGWFASARGGAPAAAPVPVAAPQREAPWRADLAALEHQLRTDMRAFPAQARPDAARRDGADAETLRRVRVLIDESERKQQKELALRIAEVATDVRAQRAADLRNIDRNLNVIQSNTGVDMLRLYRMTNDLAVRVSQTK